MQLVHVSRWNQSHVSVRVRLVRAASSHNTVETKYVILLTSMSYFDSAVLLDEADQTDITHTLTRDWFYRRASHTGG